MVAFWLLTCVVAKRLRNEEGTIPNEDELSQEALDKLPATLRTLFQEATSTRDANKADDVMQELNKVYERALTDKDLLDIDCNDKKEHFVRSLQSARGLHLQSEASLTRIQERMERSQRKSDSLQSQLGEHAHRYHNRKEMCDRHRMQREEELGRLANDLPNSKKLRESAVKGCATLSFLECEQSDGTMVVTFDDDELKKMVSNLSIDTQQFVNLNLERAVYGHHAIPSASFLSIRQRRNYHMLYGRQAEICEKIPAPTCEAFADIMSTCVGNVEDAIDELRVRMVIEDRKCRADVQTDEYAIKVERQHIADLNVELSNAVEESEEAQAEMRRKQEDWDDISKEGNTAVGSCTRELEGIEDTLCGVRRLRMDLLKLGLGKGVPFIGDCEVTDWIRGPCSAECEGGMQNITREMVSDAKLCPSLVVQRKCQEGPCARDCRMGFWGKYSECSRECGGGIQARVREIEEEPMNGGLPCEDTVQERLCNHQKCDQACVLSKWSRWSGCSRACLKGFQIRTREVLKPAQGAGKCPLKKSRTRLERRRCNHFQCKEAVPKCNSTIDLVIVVDSSGSVGASGFAEVQGFVQSFMSRFTDNARISLVSFSTNATLLTPLARKDAAVSSASSLVWLKKTTNTGEALGLADEVLLRGRREAQAIVLTVTDGMPTSKYSTTLMAHRLKNKGARIMFLTIGAALNKRVVRGWSSSPWRDNVVRVPSYNSLSAKIATQVIVQMCPMLA